ncbi:MAG: hypothetical protein JWL86_2701 [Rhizobium sp.]|nr:hypothetical protein [Rhizobium sp.]
MHRQTLCAAIANRQVVELRYDKDVRFRTFNPHIIWTADDGNIVMDGLQVSNPAKPLEKNRWRRFSLSEVKAVTVLTEKFRVEPKFYPLDPVYFGKVICVAPPNL